VGRIYRQTKPAGRDHTRHLQPIAILRLFFRSARVTIAFVS
jgi:hypothetical protein